MKHIWIITVVMGILLSVCGCSAEKAPGSVPTATTVPENSQPEHNGTASTDPTEDIASEPDSFSAFGGHVAFQLDETSTFYEIYRQVQGTATYYRIWNAENTTIDFGYYEKGGMITQIGDLLEFSMPCGTYCRWVKFYDAQNSRVSQMFNNPLALHEELVVYTDIINDASCFVVQNIFDPTTFCYIIEMDPKPNSAVQFEVSFVDSQHIQVKYPTENGEFSQVYTIE